MNEVGIIVCERCTSVCRVRTGCYQCDGVGGEGWVYQCFGVGFGDGLRLGMDYDR